jgi:lysophospholipase L1-like esterase
MVAPGITGAEAGHLARTRRYSAKAAPSEPGASGVGPLMRMTHRLLRRTAPGLLAVLAVTFAACGRSDDASARPGARTPRLGTDLRLGSAAEWGAPTVAGDGRGGYVATLSTVSAASTSARRAVRVRLRGIGVPGAGVGEGKRFVGPGVALPWTGIDHGQYVVSVGHLGRRLSLVVWSRGGDWRARVDGRYVRAAPASTGSDYARHSLDLDFSRLPRKRRTIDFELSGGAWLAGVKAAPGDRVWAPAARPSTRIYWLGDSFFAGGGSRYPGFTDMVHVASARLGLDDVTVDALGGSGYVADNASARFPHYRIRANTSLRRDRAAPNVLVVGGSINDLQFGSGRVRAAATALFAYLARALPATKVVVVPFTPHYPVPANVREHDGAVLAAARAAPNVVGAFDLPARVQALADASGAATPLNLSALQRSDGHPTPAGHALYGRLIADFISKHVRLRRATAR